MLKQAQGLKWGNSSRLLCPGPENKIIENPNSIQKVFSNNDHN